MFPSTQEISFRFSSLSFCSYHCKSGPINTCLDYAINGYPGSNWSTSNSSQISFLNTNLIKLFFLLKDIWRLPTHCSIISKWFPYNPLYLISAHLLTVPNSAVSWTGNSVSQPASVRAVLSLLGTVGMHSPCGTLSPSEFNADRMHGSEYAGDLPSKLITWIINRKVQRLDTSGHQESTRPNQTFTIITTTTATRMEQRKLTWNTAFYQNLSLHKENQ